MSGCEYEQEDFCIFEDIEGFDAKCRFKDKDNRCTAKQSDLVSYCEICGSQDCENEECLDNVPKTHSGVKSKLSVKRKPTLEKLLHNLKAKTN